MNKRLEYLCVWQTLIRDGRNPEGKEGEQLNCVRCERDQTYLKCKYYTPNAEELKEKKKWKI